jgi:hypothetical protein
MWGSREAVIMGMILCCPIAAIADGTVTNNSFETITINRVIDQTTIEAQYPQFLTGKIPKEIVSEVNKEVERFLEKSIADALQDGLSGSVLVDHKKPDPNSKVSEDISFDVIRADPHYVSIKFSRYHYEEGGAHGLMVISAFNYDIARKMIIGLGDLFEPGEPYLENLSKICTKDLLRQLGEVTESCTRGGAEPSLENLGVFAISSRGIIIYFQPYQVTSYSGGAPEVKIQFKRLSGIRV